MRERSMFRYLLWAFAAAMRPRLLLSADNLCLRQQLLVLQRRQPRPRLRDADRRFWILAYRWFVSWQTSLRTLIRRMTMENRVWGQRRIQAELARLGFKVSARTIAKYMHPIHRRGPSSRWRSFLRQHASAIWACDFFCAQTITFRTLYVFFVIHHASRQVLHVHVTPHPTAEWAAQQIVECCSWDCKPPRFLVHDRDSCYGTPFDRRAHNLGIVQVRTPFRGRSWRWHG